MHSKHMARMLLKNVISRVIRYAASISLAMWYATNPPMKDMTAPDTDQPRHVERG